MAATVENGSINKDTKESPRKTYKPEDFVIGPVKEEDYEKYVKFMMDYFLPREPLALGVHLSKAPFEKYMRKFVKSWIPAGASVCATYVPENELAGVSFTKILNREDHDICVDEKDDTNDPPDVRNLLLVLGHLEKAVDVFVDSKVKKAVEIAATAVHPKFAGNRITYRLTDELEKLAIGLGCDVARSQSTNSITQHLRKKMGFEVVYTLDYASFEIDGKRVIDLSKTEGATKADVMRKYLKKL